MQLQLWLARDQSGSIKGQLVPVEAGPQVMLQVVVEMQEPTAQPARQHELPGIVIPARWKVEVRGDDPDILQCITIPSGSSQARSRSARGSTNASAARNAVIAAYSRRVAPEPAAQLLPRVEMDQAASNDRASGEHPARVQRGVGVASRGWFLVVFGWNAGGPTAESGTSSPPGSRPAR